MTDGNLDASPNDIAIVGMALRVPGALNVREFWENLRNGVESIRTLSPDELIAAGEKPERMRGRNYVPRTADLPEMEMFDAEFFGFSPKEAAIMDPQHRHFLECAWEAMEDAGRPPQSISGPVGVFAGCGMGSYFYFNVCSQKQLVEQTGMFLLRHTGNDKDFLSTRASFAFDLHGPSVNVQTACSTSLVAVHYAAQSLLNGECDMALAGGVTIELPHRRGYTFHEGEILSPDGHCRAFDHRAAGTVFGSGVGVVVLRRLADAMADGDIIHGIIKATAINNDGASKAGYLAPSVTGQAEAIVEAQGLSGIEADSIQYVECHGTGTYLGDPIEVEALTQAFRRSTNRTGFCRIGSVKTNIGHLDTAAGVVSLIKAVLAVKHGEMPPSLGFEKPNPAINFAASPFIVNDRLTPWPAIDGPRRAAINSLGVGGTNAHAIIEEAPKRKSAPAKPADAEPHLLILSAKSRKALDDASARLAAELERNSSLALSDVAHTLFAGRKHFEQRRVLAVRNRRGAIDALTPRDNRRVSTQKALEGVSGAVFLFPGGGAQYPGMARTLYREEPAFARTVDEGLSYLPADVAATIKNYWLGDQADTEEAARIFLRPSLQLPAILIVGVAIARLWVSRGVKPAALIGHSMGENAAACVSGVLSFDRAVNLVRLRGELFDAVPGGGMLSVPLSVEQVKARLPASLDIASANAPELCVVSGADADIASFRDTLLAEGIDATRIAIDVAAHSRMLEPILARFEAYLRQTPLNAPAIPIVSNRTGTWMTASEARDPLYWVGHLRSTVQFAAGMATLAQDNARVYIEVGPGRALASLAKAQGSIKADQIINSLPHPDEDVDDRLHFLGAVGRAWATGLSVNIDVEVAKDTGRRMSLPTYAFQHQRYFLDRIAASSEEAVSDEPLLKRQDMATWGYVPTWKQGVPEVIAGGEALAARWLVFLDDTGFGAELVKRLRKRGHTVITVELGDGFGHPEAERYVLCPEHGRSGYVALLKDLAANGGVPARIVHLWLLTGDETARPGSSFFHQNQERGFYSLFYLAQTLGDEGVAAPAQITVLTNGMQSLGDELLPHPEKATVLGPAQVIPKEMPGFDVRVIDVCLPERAKPSLSDKIRRQIRRPQAMAMDDQGIIHQIVDRIWDDLFAINGSEIVAYRRERRWVRSYEDVALDKVSEGTSKFRNGGVYLITGGLGDLGLLFARELAGRFGARIVLMGRTALPEREAWAAYRTPSEADDRVSRAIRAIGEIEAAGGQVLYVRADVTNPEEVQAAVAQAKSAFGAINGVLHAAGVVKDELIQLKDPNDIEDVFAPKIYGTTVLSDVLRNEQLDIFVLFSSTSTDTAPAGQIDYVAANAFMNAFADSQARRGNPHAVAVHWGIWNELGLAARAIRAAQNGESNLTARPAGQPLLTRHVSDGSGDYSLEAAWGPSTHWVLDEHRLKGGEAVWPGTGYIETMAQAARACDIEGPFEIEELVFLRPLHVADGKTCDVLVELNTANDAHEIIIKSRQDVGQTSGYLRHAQAGLRKVLSAEVPSLDLAEIQRRCAIKGYKSDGVALRSAQEEHLRFGSRWRVLRSIGLGRGEAIAALELPEEYAADLLAGYLLHPGLMDIATGYAMELIKGYDPAAALWVPMSYETIRVYGALPARIWSWVRLNTQSNPGDDYATFDVTIADEHGRVIVDIERFTIKALHGGASLASNVIDAKDLEVGDGARASGKGELSPAMLKLAAQADQGILPSEGMEALLRAVGAGKSQIVVSSLDLRLLQKRTAAVEEATATTNGFERPALDSEFVAPRNDIEQKIAGFWSELLGVQQVGIHDSFFDLGGHSLIAVRLFRMIKTAFSVDFPISVLFEAPTIAQCAELVARADGRAKSSDNAGQVAPVQSATSDTPAHVHVVPMSLKKGRQKTPFFVCAGMFGNILNLRHLALHVGQDRPVYGLQARGLYGDQEPHETFEEMARDYIVEIRRVQPHGPYLLGGFSGGGIIAYEMAQQLVAAGEEVAEVVLLDTPLPKTTKLSLLDRAAMKLQDIRRERGAFFKTWFTNRVLWELRRFGRGRHVETHPAEQFHNDRIEAAFYRALSQYEVRPYQGRVLLLRPPLDIAYRLPGGRVLNVVRNELWPDNGWTPLLTDLTVVEVPGDHDVMVLEPNVRVLAECLRNSLRQAEKRPLAALAAE